mgnify:CR=1 FL=1
MFWKNFVSLCNNKSKSPNGVCADLGLSVATATKWKKGAVPRDTTLKRIADYFGVSTSELLKKDIPFISYKHEEDPVKMIENALKSKGDTDYFIGENCGIFVADGRDPKEVLKELYQKGLIKIPKEDKKPQGVKIPVFGAVAAGIPISAITDIEDYEEIPSDMAALGEYCALRIKGNSMEPMMLPGDTVIIKVQQDVNDGEIAVVIINGNDATCKKIKKTPEGVMLISLNPNYEPMFYSNADILELPVTVFGKVVELRRKLH